MVHMLMPQLPSSRSLLRDLADGSAHWGVRLFATLTIAVFLCGFCLLAAYFLAALIPAWDRGYGRYGVSPTDELLAVVFLAGSAAFLGITAWIWSRKGKGRVLLYPSLITLALAAVTTFLCILVESSFTGEEELIIGGIILVAIAVAMLAWLQAIRHHTSGRAFRNSQDNLPDIRCPECGYRMVGLRECRCPECGAVFTVDELVNRQDFARAPQAQSPVQSA